MMEPEVSDPSAKVTNPAAAAPTSNGAAHGPAGGGLTCGELDAAGLPEAINPALLDDAGGDDEAGTE